MTRTLRIVLALALLPAGWASAADPSPDVGLEAACGDWPNWRGPMQNRHSEAKDLPDKWNPKGGAGSNLLWKNAALASRSTPIVMNGRLYTLARHSPGTAEEGEKVICADAASGKILWEHAFNVYLSDVPDTRVAWSCCAGDPSTGRVYAQGVCGNFFCLEGDTGTVVWQRSLHEEFGLLSTYGGRTNVPIVYQDTVIASAVVIGWGDTPKWGLLAKPAHRFMAFDKATGQLRYVKGTRLIPYDTTYSTPTVATLAGQQAMVFGSGDGAIWALQPGTGLPIWKFQFSRRGINASTLVDTSTGRVFAGHSEENWVGTAMGGLAALDGNQPVEAPDSKVPVAQPLWRDFEVMAGKGSPVELDGRLYCIDDRAKLLIYDIATGERIARKALGTAQRSTPLIADGKLYITTLNGRWYVLRPTDDGVEVVHRLRLSGHACDGSPIAADGRIYIPTSKAMYCIGKTEGSEVRVQGSEDLASGRREPAETTPDPNADATHAQITPYDVLLLPGASQSYRVRLFDAKGKFIREADPTDVTCSVDGPGVITADGTYTAPPDNQHQVVLIKCRVGELEGTARVRIAPPLPWNWNFDTDDNVPLTWVGGRVRYVLRDGPEGEGKIMVKRDVLPTPRDPKNKLGTRSRLWMGPIDLADYTIGADVQLTEKDGKLPDVGLINSRYTMALQGASQEVRLYSWSTHDKRHQAVLPMELRAGIWYTMKIRVEQSGATAVVRGKVWPRGETEPTDWTIQMTDTVPNRHGSPGLFGNSKDTEIYLDNISVTLN